MKVIVDFCLVPLVGEVSLSPYIVACQRIFETQGLNHTMHAYGTNIEGEWEVVMAAIKDCHLRVHEMGAVRIHSSIKLGTRTDRDQAMADKVNSVKAKMNAS